jgi:hypothetical protein
VNMEINLWVPWGVGNFMTSSGTIHFSKTILLLEVTLKMSNTYQRAFLPQWPIIMKRYQLFYVFRVVMATIHGINTSHSNLNYITKCNSSSPQVFAAGVHTKFFTSSEISLIFSIVCNGNRRSYNLLVLRHVWEIKTSDLRSSLQWAFRTWSSAIWHYIVL